MASRILLPSMRLISSRSAALRTTRSFQSSSRRLADVAPLPVRKPVGAFRGGSVPVHLRYPSFQSNVYSVSSSSSFAMQLSNPYPEASHQELTILSNRLFGFLLGSTLAGAGVYYYILEEYKVSNELLTEDIYVRLCI